VTLQLGFRPGFSIIVTDQASVMKNTVKSISSFKVKSATYTRKDLGPKQHANSDVDPKHLGGQIGSLSLK